LYDTFHISTDTIASPSLTFHLDINGANEHEASVVSYNTPEKLEKLMDFSLPEKAGGVEGNNYFRLSQYPRTIDD
jgi:hypothetical protein